MRKLAFALFLIEAVVILAVSAPPRVDAGDIVASALDASTESAIELGNYTWIEECGLAVPLPAAPISRDAFPHLLAGKRLDDTRTAALWELGPKGLTSLQKQLESEGARFEVSENWPFRPRRHSQDVTGHRTGITLKDLRKGVVLDWVTSGRCFALVLTDASWELAQRRLDELIRELVQLEGVEQECIAPLVFQGRYAYILKGWKRDGERLRRHTPQGWLSLRVFQVPLTDFENVGRLQFELEGRLDAAGFKRSAGLKPTIAGSEGFVGEYYGNDGFVQRVAYAKLDNGYAVALMQAPEALRTTLIDEMDTFARSLQITGIGGESGAAPLFFSRVRNIRCLAWQDGRRVMWGALFDDSRQQPVIWRQDDVVWNIQMTKGSQMVREREGTANTSRALNPLVDAELRALDLPDNIEGDIELQLTVGGERTTTRLTIR
jgi:hypothetical protein